MSLKRFDYKPPKSVDERDFVFEDGEVKKNGQTLYRLGASSEVDNTTLAYYKLSVSQVDSQGAIGLLPSPSMAK